MVNVFEFDGFDFVAFSIFSLRFILCAQQFTITCSAQLWEMLNNDDT